MLPKPPVEFGDYLAAHPEVTELVRHVRRINRLPASDLRDSGNQLDMVPGYLGHGIDKYAFRVGEHVIKLLRPRSTRPFGAQLRPMKMALGVEGAEQLVAASAREEVIVTRYVDGTPSTNLSAQDLARRITPDSVDALEETMNAFQERGLYVDGSSNVLVTSGTSPRFVVIDPLNDPRDATNDANALIDDIMNWQRRPKDVTTYSPRPPEDVAYIRSAFSAARRGGR